MRTCVAALRLPGRMIVEQVAGCAWTGWPNGVESACSGMGGPLLRLMPSFSDGLVGGFPYSSVARQRLVMTRNGLPEKLIFPTCFSRGRILCALAAGSTFLLSLQIQRYGFRSPVDELAHSAASAVFLCPRYGGLCAGGLCLPVVLAHRSANLRTVRHPCFAASVVISQTEPGDLPWLKKSPPIHPPFPTVP